MSDGITRICNAHGFELRELANTLVCPQGHDCPTDWSVKTLPWSDPRTRECPIHGKRLIGSGEVLECPGYDHQVSIRASDRPKPEISRTPSQPSVRKANVSLRRDHRESPASPTETPMPKEEPPHGTTARYQRGCHCDQCTEARRKYQRDLKARKAAGEKIPRRGGARTPPRETPKARRARRLTMIGGPSDRSTAKALVRRALTPEVVTGRNADRKQLHQLAAVVVSAREQLEAAERALADHVNAFLTAWKCVPSFPSSAA